ncbi:hypothetical protein EMIHUDRAFT_245984 [Emiliania huxleyi CCMP1516]|uniref:Peptidase S8/S53 domain-containing protein n=2 Tax=Emiliania huxleyi TaxID=2903 RepID=A0A0D3IVA0_EMIH1|nr:hypothetical protein EMIHUDRAFT_245984 [Emiliania huxleyi CCMP1516]EOD15185.1 hypothetical protein EMIHUDRAFT_245984 [Emiliania huxleyi CCMP1516]|eukprot:XP_005767614.1 hypothetical protein EMIHUDRAFT_245984 [Emiliania huxleyi CCMP1516]
MTSLFLALLASAAAAPATKGRPRATEPPSPPATPPKIRYVVTEEKQTNVATTKGGARAPSKVAQMADVVGGEVKKTIEAALKTLTVVEFEDNSTARAFQDQAERSGLRVEEDQQRFLATSSASASRKRQLAEGTPWGIERVYNEAVPDASFFPSAGVVGVYPGAPDLKIVKVFGEVGLLDDPSTWLVNEACGWTYASEVVDAAQRCVGSGAKILSMSLGGGFSSDFERDAFQKFFNDGILSIAAAGNGGSSSYFYRGSYSWVMRVAAPDSNNGKGGFSQYNGGIDIAAPGVDVVLTVGPPSYTGVGPPGYGWKRGTSMAAPHVFGLAMVYPSFDNADIRTALEQGAEDLGLPGIDDYYGHGLANYQGAEMRLLFDKQAPVSDLSYADSTTGRPWAECGQYTSQWWGVDLGSEVYVRYVRLQNRNDCCAERLTDVDIYLGSTAETYTGNALVKSDVSVLSNVMLEVEINALGRYIYLNRPSAAGLTVCKFYDSSLFDKQAPVSDLSYADSTTGRPWAECGQYTSQWWGVDLGSEVYVRYVRLQNRNDCCPHRLTGIDIYLGTTAETYTGNALVKSDVSVLSNVMLEVEINALGRYIYLNRPSATGLTVCKFYVYGYV